MNNYLEVRNLSKSFESFQLHDITFTLPEGYIMGLMLACAFSYDAKLLILDEPTSTLPISVMGNLLF